MYTSPDESRRAHFKADTDVSARSLHHTLGTGKTQASPGDHIHDGVTSKKLGLLELNPDFDEEEPESETNPKFRPAFKLSANNAAGIIELLHTIVEFREA
jgi:hypothetical protein